MQIEANIPVNRYLFAVGIVSLMVATHANARIQFDNIDTSLQYAYALRSSEDKVLGYGAASNKLETFRFQHEHDYNFGHNFFLYDHLRSNKPLGGPVFGPYDPAAFSYGPDNSTYFAVIGTELYASKALGAAVGTGIYKNFGLSARLERGGYYDFRAQEIGPQIHLNVPGFDTFKVTMWRRWKSDISGSAAKSGFDVGTRTDYRTSWLGGIDWKTSWHMLGYPFSSQAFIRYQLGDGAKADATGTENINGIPARLWIEPDIFIHFSKMFSVGLRDYFLWQKDAIDNGYSTSGRNSHHVPQVVLRLDF